MMQKAVSPLLRSMLTKTIRMPLRHFASGPIIRPRKGGSQFMLDGNFPFDVNGVWALPEQPERPIVSSFLEKRGVEYSLMNDILTEKFFTFTQALTEKDEGKIRAMAETRFADKLINSLGRIQNTDLKFEKDSSLV
jgi:hypothetical protein